MDFLKIITVESKTHPEEGSIAINTDISGNPVLEYYKNKQWIPLDNLRTINRMARLDDLYTHLYFRDWGIGPRFSEKDGNLYIHTELHSSPIPVLSEGIKISEHLTSEELIDDMNKEIDIYYDSLVSTRDLLDGSSVVDLWEYPVEYGTTLNLVTLPSPKNNTISSPTIRLAVSWIVEGSRKTETMTFNPWEQTDEKIVWSEFQRDLGEGEVVVEFHDGCIRVFSGCPDVTECIIHHCSATYDRLL